MNERLLRLEKSTIDRANTRRITAGLLNQVPSLSAAWLSRRLLTPWGRVAPLDLSTAQQRMRLRSASHPVSAGIWGSGPLVILVHGWSGGGSQFEALRRTLVAAGFSVAAFDAPAHGGSPGRRTHTAEFAALTAEVAQHWGPAHALIGHSLGGLASTLAVGRGLDVQGLVLFAPLPSFDFALDGLQDALGLSEALREGVARKVEREVRVTRDEAVASKLMGATRTLLLHDRSDRRIPVLHSRALAAQLASVDYLETSGLGHRGALSSAAVLERVVHFVDALPRCRQSPLDRSLQQLPEFRW